PRAVCDRRPEKAARAARSLHCYHAAGPAELFACDDVDAVLMLARQWYGLWPLTLAAALAKPVYSAVSLAADEVHAERLAEQVQRSRLHVQMACPWASWPAFAALCERVSASSNRAMAVRLDCWLKRRSCSNSSGLPDRTLLDMLMACGRLIGSACCRVAAQAAVGHALTSIVLEFGPDRIAQISSWRTMAERAGARCQVETSSELAVAEFPARLTWKNREGQHERRPAAQPWRVADLAQFA